MNYPFKHLVLQGSGVKGMAYLGALRELEKTGILSQIEAVASTSAGAITALLICLRYSAQEIQDLLDAQVFQRFEDGWDPFRIVSEYGMYQGDTCLDWIQTLIRQKDLPTDVNFQTLKERGFRDLYVFATDLNLRKVKEFSFEAHAQTPVAEAIRAALAIPLFFKAWRFTNEFPDNHLYVDGGLLRNYPIDFFDQKGKAPASTLGLLFEQTPAKQTDIELDYNEIYNYISALFDTQINNQPLAFKDSKRSIRINDYGLSATDFKLSSSEKKQLISAGQTAAQDFLKQFSNPLELKL